MLVTNYNWKYSPKHDYFENDIYPYDYVKITHKKNKIELIVPMKNSCYLFKTTVKSNEDAMKLLEMHLDNFENK